MLWYLLATTPCKDATKPPRGKTIKPDKRRFRYRLVRNTNALHKTSYPTPHYSLPRCCPSLHPSQASDPVPISPHHNRLTTEAVEGAALSLQSIDDVERRDRLPLGVLSVGDGITDDTLEEGLEDTTRLLVDHGRDTLDTATTGQTTDGGLGDTLDVVTKNLSVALGTALAEALAALAAYGRVSSCS